MSAIRTARLFAAAALLCALPAHAQQLQLETANPQPPAPAPELRFRYLGITGDFALMASEASGPQTERELTAILANRTASGPGGVDNAVWHLKINCETKRFALLDVYGYLHDDQLSEAHGGTWVNVPIPDETPNGTILRFACTGAVQGNGPVWVTGTEPARQFAMTEIAAN